MEAKYVARFEAVDGRTVLEPMDSMEDSAIEAAAESARKRLGPLVEDRGRDFPVFTLYDGDGEEIGGC